MDQNQLLKALEDLPVSEIRYYPITGSTNDQAAEWAEAEAGAPDLALVAAGAQSAGRGRMGRRWVSPAGQSLSFSLVLRPRPGDMGVLARFSALGALAVCEALQGLEPALDVQIKWPNDILVNRKKAGGVLPEMLWSGDQLQAVVLGVGLNLGMGVLEDPALQGSDFLFPAAALEESLGYRPEPAELLKAVLIRLIDWREHLASPGFIQEWESRLAFRGEWVQMIRPTEGSTEEFLQGKLLGLEDDGALRLETQAGEVLRIQAGEIRLRPLTDSGG